MKEKWAFIGDLSRRLSEKGREQGTNEKKEGDQ